jgi:polar amino acid transport system permease protein
MLDLIQTYGVYYLIGQYPNGPLGGLALTFLLASAGLILALPVGIVLGLCRVSPFAVLRWPATALVYVVRGTPLLMVIFWAYFLLPTITGQRTDQFSTMLTALVIFDGAYLAEIVRAGIQAHLTPSRAQPRDPSELASDYRTERSASPSPTTTEAKP